MINNALPVQPHLYLADTLGRPLDGGKVFFGEPNKDPEIYPINVFYDDALTIPAPQPIRSKGGFMNANGDIVEIYANEVRYSVKILDSYGRQVFYKPEMVKNQDVSGGLESASDLLGVQNPTDGMTLTTNSYLAGKKVGGNTYRYNSARAAENDGGSIINGWEVVGKKEFYPEDFGVLPNIRTLDNNANLKRFLQSGLRLKLEAKEYNFTAFTSLDITKPLFLTGSGMSLSKIDNVQLIYSTSGSEVKDVLLATNSNNYTVYITEGDNNTHTRVKAYHNFDGFCIYSAAGKPNSNRFVDCVSEKSGRVGFTADNGATNTYFDNCTAIDCKQGFHAEASTDTYITNALTDGCGLLSSIASGENLTYEGSLRSYAVHGLYVKGFKNINPKGRCQWQHGGHNAIKSSNLVFEDLSGMGPLIMDNEAGMTTNLTVKRANDFAIYAQSLLQKVDGIVTIEEVTGTHETTLQTNADIITLKNANLGRVLLESKKDDSTIILDNVQLNQSLFNVFTADHIYIKNGLVSNQTSIADPEWYHGLRFDLTKAKTFIADKIEVKGSAGGIHLSFIKPTGQLETGYIGSYVAKISAGISLNKYANIGAQAFSELNIAITLHKTIYADTLPDFGTWRSGDIVRKITTEPDMIYGWVCVIPGTGTGATWKPLKHS